MNRKFKANYCSFAVLAALMAFLLAMNLSFVGCSKDSETEPGDEQPAPSTSSPAVPSQGATGGVKSLGPFKVIVPEGWMEESPSSAMRKAQYRLPKIEGDTEDGELIAFYFGQGQGGSVEANIDRWIGQISQPGGSPSKEKAKTTNREVAGMKVTLVDVSGTYTNAMMGNSSPRTGYRMLAAVIETGEGPWFFKLVGPEKTVAKWSGSFDQFINSLKL
jgi:hypothetical protein